MLKVKVIEISAFKSENVCPMAQPCDQFEHKWCTKIYFKVYS